MLDSHVLLPSPRETDFVAASFIFQHCLCEVLAVKYRLGTCVGQSTDYFELLPVYVGPSSTSSSIFHRVTSLLPMLCLNYLLGHDAILFIDMCFY